jgi:hypothetical protein
MEYSYNGNGAYGPATQSVMEKVPLRVLVGKNGDLSRVPLSVLYLRRCPPEIKEAIARRILRRMRGVEFAVQAA